MLKSVSTVALLASAGSRILTNGSLSQVWGMINGVQLAVYLPLSNVPISQNAIEVCSAIAEVVTFDIPGIDMESVFGSIVECPEQDGILTDFRED